MKNSENETTVSERISNFLKFTQESCAAFRWHTDELARLDKLTQDYLHSLELGGMDYKGRAKLATALARCRKERRAHKNALQVLRPAVEYTESDHGKRALSLLSEALGHTRKEERKLDDPVYWYRILPHPPIRKDGDSK